MRPAATGRGCRGLREAAQLQVRVNQLLRTQDPGPGRASGMPAAWALFREGNLSRPSLTKEVSITSEGRGTLALGNCAAL